MLRLKQVLPKREFVISADITFKHETAIQLPEAMTAKIDSFREELDLSDEDVSDILREECQSEVFKALVGKMDEWPPQYKWFREDAYIMDFSVKQQRIHHNEDVELALKEGLTVFEVYYNRNWSGVKHKTPVNVELMERGISRSSYKWIRNEWLVFSDKNDASLAKLSDLTKDE